MQYAQPPASSTNTRNLQHSSDVATTNHEARYSIWSNSQLSDIPSRMAQVGTLNTHQPSPRSVELDSDVNQRPSSSFTINDNVPSKGGKELRIVIERPASDRPKSAEEPAGPALEVPIPHHKIGRFRFTTGGSPLLRSSAYTRTTTSDVLNGSVSGNFDQDEISNESQRLNSLLTSSRSPSRLESPIPSQSPVFYQLKEPIESNIYDSLTHTMDDPSVVRYVKGTHEISAATPARIVAQISSDSFMDYELVSDFFLTFRSYLSLNNLLSLLLARLEWAINRRQEDGRIIRIRVFAALRHWILNYFVDDFVVNSHLREQFCQRINHMYTEVKSQTKNSVSDLKILLDLKRCWNGRCALYWDSPEFSNDSQPDDRVAPGGGAQNRNSKMPEHNAIHSSNIENNPRTKHNNTPELPAFFEQPGDRGLYPPAFHGRQNSDILPQQSSISNRSVKSVQAVSCSLPARPLKCGSVAANPSRNPHPVLVSSGRRGSSAGNPFVSSPLAPIWRRPAHSHKRSGSFSDSIRDDRAPLPSANIELQNQPLSHDLPYPGSLIRGDVCIPVDPYVTSLGPSSPTFELPELNFRSSESLIQSDWQPKLPGPGVKTFIGSIRRAFHHRQSFTNLPTVGGNNPQTLRGKTSTLPSNVTFGSDTYRDKRLGSSSRPVRIDVLCNDVTRRHREIVAQKSQRSGNLPSHYTQQQPAEATQLLAPSGGGAVQASQDLGPLPGRIPSQMTTGSKSIVIVDDTGFDMALMSGALQPCSPARTAEADVALSPTQNIEMFPESRTPQDGNDFREDITQVGDSTELFQPLPDSVRNGSKMRIQRSSSLTHGRPRLSSASRPSKLRKYASYQSGMVSHVQRSSGVKNNRNDQTEQSPERPLGRMLRRRPGGDLRKFMNVHDLETEPRPQSIASGTSNTISVSESILYIGEHQSMADPAVNGERQRLQNSHHSFIQTGSSRLMRSSFEAAVAGFSQMPDDDDGGVESTLLKLEGKWKRPPNSYPYPLHGNQTQPALSNGEGNGSHVRRLHRDHHVFENGDSGTLHSDSFFSSAYSDSILDSEDSYCSIPLLERGLGNDVMVNPEHGSPQPQFSGNAEPTTNHESLHPSIDMVDEADSLRRNPQTPAASNHTEQISAEENQVNTKTEEECNNSDISSEISVDLIDRNEALDRPTPVDNHNVTFSSLGIMSHPLAHPPSPPITVHNPNSISHSINTAGPSNFQQQPITPDLSPIGKKAPNDGSAVIDSQQHASDVLLKAETQARKPAIHEQIDPDHAPFILASDSRVLAEQYTLVEKAALSEVDWKDLVDMKWSQSSQSPLNWADYLAAHYHKGIDIVVARFNLMVKWAVSEIVLTKDINERAQTITKLIHTAVHARRIRNYSTMLQITIALSCVDITRLTRTWELVPFGEKRVLRDMEFLIQPTRNFYNLRQEMETTHSADGCIPFVGEYRTFHPHLLFFFF